MTEQLPVETIVPNPRNPRELVGEAEIAQLAQTIERQGLLNPVIVRPHPSSESPDGESSSESSESESESESTYEYELVSGERRLRAVQQLGWDTIEATVRELTDEQALELTITENLQREDVSPIEEARGYKQLIKEYDLTQAEAADRLGVSRSHISNQLRLLKLPTELQEYVLRKTWSPWQAHTLASVWDDYRLLDLVLDHDLSVAEIREIIADLDKKEEEEEVAPIRVSTSVPVEALADATTTTDELREWGLDEETIGDLRMRDLIEYQLWAVRQTELDVRAPPLESELAVRPVQYHPGAGKVIHGSLRVEYAIEHGYEGELEVEIQYPRRYFDADALDPEPIADVG